MLLPDQTELYNRYCKARESLIRLISIPSTSGMEGECAQGMAQYLLSYGCDVIRTGNNLIVISKHYDPKRATLLLNSHLDTVKPSEGYTFNPCTPFEDDTRIAGLGSNDAKASVACLTETFLYFEQNPLIDYNLILILSSEEENSGKGGIELALLSSPAVDCAIVGEPTGMRAAVAERGLLVVDGTARGKSGHAARNEGINAIDIAMEDISWLKGYRFGRISSLMEEVKCTVTGIKAGTQHNVIPDCCTFMIDIRTNERYTNQEIMEILSANMKSSLKARSLSNKSSVTPAGHPLVKCAGELGVETYISPTTSDWMRMSFPAIKMGPGDSSRSHTADEYILKEELMSGVEGYINFVANLKL